MRCKYFDTGKLALPDKLEYDRNSYGDQQCYMST